MTVSRYPDVDGTILAQWGPGRITSGKDSDGIDAVVVGHEIDMRPDGATVASIEIIGNDGAGDPSVAVGAELTIDDLMKIADWAYGRAYYAQWNDTTLTTESVHEIEVRPTFDTGDEVTWVEDAEGMVDATAWSVYLRVGDPSDQFVKAEFLADFDIESEGEPDKIDEAKRGAMRLAFLLSAGRLPIQLFDPR